MAGVAVERVLQKLDGVQKITNGWKARCPAHEDVHQSLQISERADQSVGLHCHAGCDKGSLLGAMSLTFADLYAPKTSDGKQIVGTHDYRAIDGTLLYQAVRFYPKEFRQRRPDGAQWKWDMLPLKGKHVAYRLPELKGRNVVVVVEGEKDADRLWKLGIPATTNIGGAKKWGSSETKSLQAAGVSRVLIIPDNDDAGAAHAVIVAKSVKGAGMACSVVELPDLPEHGDVSDWLEMGHTKEELQALLAAMPYVVPSGHAATPIPAPEAHHAPADGLSLSEPDAYSQTQTGAAEALRDRFGTRLRYDHGRVQWFIWDEHRWRPDSDEAIIRLAIDHIRRWSHEIIAVPDFTERKKWQDFTLKLEKRSELVAMVTSARALQPISVGENPWDQQPWLLGVPNGVVDLRTGVLRAGAPTDLISQQVGAIYDPNATCPRWLTFLDQVFDGDLALIEFVHRALGYSLTGDMREQCFFLAIGTGSNGKSIFLNTLESVWGSYGQRASMGLFTGESTDYHMADLLGSRIIFAAESKTDTRLNEEVIKALTGGETQKAKRLYGHPFTFRPMGKIWLAVNHPPKVMDDSYGFWRRVRLLPFNRTFSGSTDDRMLRDTLKAEESGILNWAIQGTQEWLTKGLERPASVMLATDEYQNSEDPLLEFFADRCKLEPNAVETFSALFTAYNMWAEKQKVPRGDRMTRRVMGTHLKRRFQTKDVEGVRRYLGIQLVRDDEPPSNLYDD